MQYVVDIRFVSRVSDFSLLEFSSLQQLILVTPGESTLVFFRIYNPTAFDVTGLSLYYIFPIAAALYVNKVQCFCFDIVQVHSLESIELPVLFYLSSIMSSTSAIYVLFISYVFFIR